MSMISSGLSLSRKSLSRFGIYKKQSLDLATLHFATTELRYSSVSTMAKTAGVIIIGDEILKGQTQDTNSYFICKTLRTVGVSVQQISVIGDDIDLISQEVRKYSDKFDIVLTSGGIGPTHDDLTLEAVAKAFDEKLYLNPELLELCKKYFGEKPVDSPEMKLAHIPQSSQLYFGVDSKTGERLKFPLITQKNVYVFPGIPVLLERQMESVKQLLKSEDVFHSKTVLVNCFETQIANVLTKCAEKYKAAGLTVGSYPDWFNNYYKVKLIVECTNENILNQAVELLQKTLPMGSIVSDYKPMLESEEVVKIFDDGFFNKISPTLPRSFADSVGILKEAFERYKPEEICIGFNGGKDCTALLHLYYAVALKFDKVRAENLIGLFIKTDESFEEIERFMKETNERYGLRTIHFQGAMKSELGQLREDRPEIKAVIMGTRATDPYSKNLEAFSPTDGDWPPFMRVNPILNWTYHDVWSYLRGLCLPYCVLYDRGYTSLGGKSKTERNEKLKVVDEQGIVRYLPAYTLKDSENERFGRL